MTDRHAGYIVVLNSDIREDDAERIIDAIAMIKGVKTVTPVVANIELAIAEERTRLEILEKLYDFIRSLSSQ